LGAEGYAKFFAPKTAQQLRALTGARAPVGSGDDLGDDSDGGGSNTKDIANSSLDDLV